MAANNEIASAYIALYPKFVDAKKNISDALGNKQVQEEADNAGKKAGSSFAKGLGGAIQEAGSVYEGLGNTLGKVGDQLTNKITKPALAAGVATAGIVIGAGWGRLVQIDTAQAKLTALGHSGESVKEIMQSANDAVTGTSYSLADAATAAASATAAGVKSGSELTRYLTNIADVSAIANTEFNSTADIFNKVQSSGKAYYRDLKLLANSGIPIYQYLAEELGVTTDEVQKLGSAGQISSEQFYRAIEKNLGGAAQTIGELSVSAAWSNIQASIARIGANFLNAGGDGQGFFDQVKPLLNELLGELKGLEGGASEFGVQFGKAFADGVYWIRSNKDNIADFGREVLSVFKSSGEIVSGFFGSVQDFYKSLSPQTKQQVKDFAAAALAVSTFAGPLLKVLSPALVGVGRVMQSFGGYVTTVSKNLSSSNTAVKNFSALLNPLRGGLIAVGTAAVAIGVGFAAKAWGDYKKRVEDLDLATSGLSGQAWRAEKAYFDFGKQLNDTSGQFSDYAKSFDEVVTNTAELATNIQESFANYGAEAAELDRYVDTIQRFGDIAEPTAKDIEDLRIAVEGYNRITGDSVTITDDTNGALDRSIESIVGAADAWKELALAQVLQEKSQEVISNLVDAEIAYGKAQEDTAEARKNYIEAVDNGLGSQDQLLQILQKTEKTEAEAKAVVDEHNKALDDYANILAESRSELNKYKGAITDYINNSSGLKKSFDEAGISVDDFSEALAYLQVDVKDLSKISDEELTNIAQSYDGNLGNLASLLNEKGLEITTSWADGQSAGIPLVDSSIDEIRSTVSSGFDDISKNASASGKSTVENFSSPINSANGQLNSSANAGFYLPLKNNFDKTARQSTDSGRLVPQNYSGAIDKYKGGVNTSTNAISRTVSTNLTRHNSKSSGWGRELVTNFASGISKYTGAVTNAVSTVAQTVRDYLGHSKPKKGALSVGETIWGVHMMENLADGIRDGSDDVINAVEDLTEEAASILSESSVLGMDDINARLFVSGENVGSNNVELMGSLSGLAELLQGLKVVLDSGEVVGGLMPEINNQLGALV